LVIRVPDRIARDDAVAARSEAPSRMVLATLGCAAAAVLILAVLVGASLYGSMLPKAFLLGGIFAVGALAGATALGASMLAERRETDGRRGSSAEGRMATLFLALSYVGILAAAWAIWAG
jgi:uncharacterized membrane protein